MPRIVTEPAAAENVQCSIRDLTALDDPLLAERTVSTTLQ